MPITPKFQGTRHFSPSGCLGGKSSECLCECLFHHVKYKARLISDKNQDLRATTRCGRQSSSSCFLEDNSGNIVFILRSGLSRKINLFPPLCFPSSSLLSLSEVIYVKNLECLTLTTILSFVLLFPPLLSLLTFFLQTVASIPVFSEMLLSLTRKTGINGDRQLSALKGALDNTVASVFPHPPWVSQSVPSRPLLGCFGQIHLVWPDPLCILFD